MRCNVQTAAAVVIPLVRCVFNLLHLFPAQIELKARQLSKANVDYGARCYLV